MDITKQDIQFIKTLSEVEARNALEGGEHNAYVEALLKMREMYRARYKLTIGNLRFAFFANIWNRDNPRRKVQHDTVDRAWGELA